MHENGTLEIKRVRPEDQGTYTFVASNILGKAEDQVRLEVKGEHLKSKSIELFYFPNKTGHNVLTKFLKGDCDQIFMPS